LGLTVTGPGRISFSASVAEGNRLAYSVNGKDVRQFRQQPDADSEQHNTELGEGEHYIDFDFEGAECLGDGIGDINIDVEGNADLDEGTDGSSDGTSDNNSDADTDSDAATEDEDKTATITVAGAFNPLTLLVSLLLLPLLRRRQQPSQ
jgi:hypothetical protein